MIKSKPLVSVIMPAYNAEKFISDAIESILSQTFRDFELVVVDDSSTDQTVDIARRFAREDRRIRIVRPRTIHNIARVLNYGIRLARSNIIARMDADDIAYPERLEFQYKVINSARDIAVVGADITIINTQGDHVATRRYPASSEDLKKCLFRYSSFAHPVVMFRKDLFEKVGRYDPKYSPTEDLDLWFRLGRNYEFRSIQQQLLKYRLSEQSSSHSALKNLEMLVFNIRLNAITRYGYRPSLYDVLYNLLEFTTLWFTNPNHRIMIYNLLRNNGIL